MDEIDDWITLRRACEIMQPVTYWPPASADAIKEAAAEGLLSVKALLALVSNGPGGEERHQNRAVPLWVWQSVDYDFDLVLSGYKARCGSAHGYPLRIELTKVYVSESQLRRHFDVPALDRTQIDSANGDPPLSHSLRWNWAPVWLDLAAYIYADGFDQLDVFEFGGKARLRDWLLARFNHHFGKEPSRMTVETIATQIIESARQAKPQKTAV